MLISHSKQFAFFRVPKTGSTSAESMLRKAMIWDLDSGPPNSGNAAFAHATPNDAVALGHLTNTQLSNYALFAFYRDPIERWASIVSHNLPKGLTIEFERFTDAITSGTAQLGKLMGRPQTDYLPATLLPFEDFQSGMLTMFSALGLPMPALEARNVSPPRQYDVATELGKANRMTKVRALFVADFTRSGK